MSFVVSGSLNFSKSVGRSFRLSQNVKTEERWKPYISSSRKLDLERLLSDHYLEISWLFMQHLQPNFWICSNLYSMSGLNIYLQSCTEMWPDNYWDHIGEVFAKFGEQNKSNIPKTSQDCEKLPWTHHTDVEVSSWLFLLKYVNLTITVTTVTINTITNGVF